MTLRSYDATYDVFKGYDLTILENFVSLRAKQNRRGYGDRESVRKSYDRRMPPQGDRAIRGIRSVYGCPTMIVDQM